MAKLCPIWSHWRTKLGNGLTNSEPAFVGLEFAALTGASQNCNFNRINRFIRCPLVAQTRL